MSHLSLSCWAETVFEGVPCITHSQHFYLFLKCFCFCAKYISTLDPVAILSGGEEEAVSTGPGNTHPEDLPGLEVPHPFPATEEESGGGGCLVSALCGKNSLNIDEGLRPALHFLSLSLQSVRISHICLFGFVATKEVPED